MTIMCSKTLMAHLLLRLLLAGTVSSFSPPQVTLPLNYVVQNRATGLQVISSLQIIDSAAGLDIPDGVNEVGTTSVTSFASSSVDFINTNDDGHFLDPFDSEYGKVGTHKEYMPRSLLPDRDAIMASSTNRLSRIELQKAITDVKRFVEARLESDLNVFKVSY